MQIQENYQLQNLNTFGISAKAKYFVEVFSLENIQELLTTPEFQNEERLILGGGSNMLFTKDFDGLVILNSLKGIEHLTPSPSSSQGEGSNHPLTPSLAGGGSVFPPLPRGGLRRGDEDEMVLVRAMAGENWHDFVMYAVWEGWYGIENLALIPGSVGAVPVQNIGAYGVEIKDTLHSVEALEIETGKMVTFSNEDCRFGYRDSFFKNEGKGKYIITSVTFQLSQKPNLNTSYGAIQTVLDEKNITNPTIKDIADAVISIRQSKLPDPVVIGNAGSFFKNPVINKDQFIALQEKFPEVKFYELDNGEVKIPAAWLIETAGWKGKRVGNVGVHDKQALVLVNHGGGTGEEIKNLALDIQQSVKDMFGIDLEMEVTVV